MTGPGDHRIHGDQQPPEHGEPVHQGPVAPADLVRQLLADAREAAAARGITARRRRGIRPPRRRSGWSGARPDERDPQALGAATAAWVQGAGLSREIQDARVFSDWSEIVGAELARHCRPRDLSAGRLLVEAESTAWATQIRLLSSTVLGRLSSVLGPDVVTAIEVRGPTAPSWVRGQRRVKGRGPRDTYG